VYALLIAASCMSLYAQARCCFLTVMAHLIKALLAISKLKLKNSPSHIVDLLANTRRGRLSSPERQILVGLFGMTRESMWIKW
jgi:hypothetical protein